MDPVDVRGSPMPAVVRRTHPASRPGLPALAFEEPNSVDPRNTIQDEWDEGVQELGFRLVAAGLFLLAVLLVGVVGYRIVDPEAGWIDSLYMTVITLTTVGFTEVIDLTGHPGGRLFTVGLIFLGMGGVLYFVSTATAFVLEGQLGHVFRRRRMERRVASMSDHLIVCGSGGTAVYTASELEAVQRPVGVVCDDPDAVERLRQKLEGIPVLIGDPTLDETLLQAGIERAAGVAACTDSDKDNLIVTLTARQLNPDIRIVSGISDVAGARKIENVGADAVVSPDHIGALRIASELIRPTVVSFLDLMLRDGTGGLRVDEVRIPEGSSVVGTSVEALELRSISNALLVAYRLPDGGWRYNPPPDLEIEAGSVLILLGTPDDVAAVADAVDGDMLAPTHSRKGG